MVHHPSPGPRRFYKEWYSPSGLAIGKSGIASNDCEAIPLFLGLITGPARPAVIQRSDAGA